MTLRSLLLLSLLAISARPLEAQSTPESASLLGDSTAATADIEAFARLLESEIGAGRAEIFAERFDGDTFLDRANEGRQIGAMLMGELRRQFRQNPDFLDEIVNDLRSGGHYRFLRVVERDGALRARFRLLSSNGGINYHDLLLSPDATGEGQIVDLYVFLTAEDLSSTIGRLMDVLAAEEAYSPRTEAYTTFIDHYNAGQFREAWGAYPDEYIDAENKKAMMLMRVMIGMNVGDREYYQALQAFADAFPGDPSLSLLQIDVHHNSGDFEALLETVNRLEESVGEDPYLNMYRGIAHDELDAPKVALQHVREALSFEPKVLLPNAFEFELLVELERFEEAADALRRISDMGIELNPYYIESEASNQAFVQSKAYQAWLNKRGS